MNERLKERIAEEWAMLDPVDPLRRLLSDVIDVLSQPAQPAQEPVAWAVYHKRGGSKSLHWPENHSPNGDATMFDAVPLVPQRPWVGLTEEQFTEAARLAEGGNYLVAFQRIQQCLKEKNNG